MNIAGSPLGWLLALGAERCTLTLNGLTDLDCRVQFDSADLISRLGLAF